MQRKDKFHYDFENAGLHDLSCLPTRLRRRAKGTDNTIIIKPGGAYNLEALKFEKTVRRFYYRFVGSDSIFAVKPFGWPRPKQKSPREKITPFPLDHPSVQKVDGKTIELKSGTVKFDDLLLFPEGYKLVVTAGTNISSEKEMDRSFRVPFRW